MPRYVRLVPVILSVVWVGIAVYWTFFGGALLENYPGYRPYSCKLLSTPKVEPCCSPSPTVNPSPACSPVGYRIEVQSVELFRNSSGQSAMNKLYRGCDDVSCDCLYASEQQAQQALNSLDFTVNETVKCWYNGSGSIVVLVNQGFSYNIALVGLVLLALGALLLCWSVLHVLGLDCKLLEIMLRCLCCGHFDEWELRRRRRLWQHTQAYGANRGGLAGLMLRARTGGLLPDEIREILRKIEISHQELEDLKKRAESGVDERNTSSVDAPLEPNGSPALTPVHDAACRQPSAAEGYAGAVASDPSPTVRASHPLVVGDLIDCGICLDELTAPLAAEDHDWEDDVVRESQLRRRIAQAAPSAPVRSAAPQTHSAEDPSADPGPREGAPAASPAEPAGIQSSRHARAGPTPATQRWRHLFRPISTNEQRSQTDASSSPSTPTTTARGAACTTISGVDIEAGHGPSRTGETSSAEAVAASTMNEGAGSSSTTAAPGSIAVRTVSGSRRIVLLKCGHIFHFSCMKHFLCAGGVTCPICNRNLPRDYLTDSGTVSVGHASQETTPRGTASEAGHESTRRATASAGRPADAHAASGRRWRGFWGRRRPAQQPAMPASSSAYDGRVPNESETGVSDPAVPPRAVIGWSTAPRASETTRREADYGLVMVPHVSRNPEDIRDSPRDACIQAPPV